MQKQDGIKVVTIGGGTGSFMLLSGLKRYTSSLTAIVNMVDDGGSTGRLRDEFGTLPSGDVRQCLVALAESDRVRNLFNYRFENKGDFKGHSFGNVFISTLEQVTGSFSEAIETASEVLNISGQVLPVTLSDIKLTYKNKDGEVVIGEHVIGDTDLLETDEEPELSFDNRALLNPRARTALLSADLIVIAPGTLYGSLAPALMVEGLREAIEHSKARVVYVANLMNTAGTKGYTIQKIHSELGRFIGNNNLINHILINKRDAPEELTSKYNKQQQALLKVGNFSSNTPRLTQVDLLRQEALEEDLIRHDPDKVARALMKIYFS